MLAQHTFNIVLVSAASPVGFSFEPSPTTTVTYSGEEVQVTL
jgi:hypothetical protein